MKENVILIGVAIVLIVVGILCLVSGAPPATLPPEPETISTPADNDLCGRYHLRKRSTRFFRRVC